MEELDIRNLAITDPRAFLDQFPEGAILGEIQRAPQLLSYIQSRVDLKEEKGFYFLTGSHQLQLQEAITQSLAGRTAILTLLRDVEQSINSIKLINYKHTTKVIKDQIL